MIKLILKKFSFSIITSYFSYGALWNNTTIIFVNYLANDIRISVRKSDLKKGH